MTTALTELLGIEEPVIQGGMAWIADAELAAAVANAGGAGIIAAGNAPADFIRAEIRKARALTDKQRSIGVNVMLMSPTADEIAELCVEEKVSFVTTGAGNPGKYISKWKDAGIKVIPVVPSVNLAKRMEKIGVDAVIAEGMESGGHIGENTTFCLVPQVADALSIPVIAAGGIADNRGFKAALALGACGVQCGTVFLASDECTVHENYKKLVVNAGDTDVAVTGRMTGHPCRGIKTAFARKLIKLEKDAPEGWADKFEELTLGGLRKAAKDGNEPEGSFLAGNIAGMIKEIRPCLEIIKDIVGE